MDLLQLRYFRVVARVEHMTKAAEELFIAQPSLSKTIGRLEKEIGVPLFDRQGRVIRLNKFGKAFLEHINTLFRELEEGQRKVRVWPDLNKGRFRWLRLRCTGFQTRYIVSRPSILPFAFTYLNAHSLKCHIGSKQERVISASCPLRL